MKKYILSNPMLDIKELVLWANNLKEAKDKAVLKKSASKYNQQAYWIHTTSKR